MSITREGGHGGPVGNIGPGGVVAVLTPRGAGPVPEVVELLSDLLQKAKDGEIIGVAVAAAATHRCDGSVYCIGDGDIATLVLACERVKMRLLREGEDA